MPCDEHRCVAFIKVYSNLLFVCPGPQLVQMKFKSVTGNGVILSLKMFGHEDGYPGGLPSSLVYQFVTSCRVDCLSRLCLKLYNI